MGYFYKISFPFNFKNLVISKLLLLIFLFFGSEAFAQCPTVTSLNQSFCDTESPTIANLQVINNGGGVAWFASPTSPTPLSLGQGLVNGQSYYADNAAGNCGNRTQVTVTVYSAPTGSSFQGPCVDFPEQATISTLILSGNNIQWYNVPTGGTPLAANAILVPNTIYYASQTNPDTGCETSRFSVFVTFGVVPVPVGPPIQAFCQDPSNPPTVADLIASGNNNWYLTSTSGLPLPENSVLIDGQTYYATTVDPPCQSVERLEVLVSIQPQNNAGVENNVVSFCENEIANSNFIDLFTFLGGNPSNNGVWTGSFSTTNGSLGTLDMSFLSLSGSPYVFTYSVNSSTECPPDSSTVTITINPIPNAGTNGQTTVCETDPSFDLFTLLGNNPETGGEWSPELASQTGVFTPGVDQPGTYTYTIIGTFPCENSTASVTVEVESIPNPGTAGTAAFCENGAPDDLFNYLGGTPDQGGQWSPPLASGTGVFDPAQDPEGPYTYTVGEQGECDPQSTTVIVTINEIPNAGTNGQTTVCETDPSFDLFTLLGNNPEINGTWSPELASGTGIFTPGVDQADTYTYTIIGTFPCENSTATVTVEVESIPNPGEAGTAAFCENGAPEDLFNYLGGTPDQGGTWSPPLASSTGVFDPSQDPAGPYTYTVGEQGECDPQSTTVIVTINEIPNSGTNGQTTVCETDPSFDLFTLLGNNPELNGTWSPELASQTGVFTPGVDQPGTYTYTITGTFPCENSTATVTVELESIPNPGEAGTAAFCENGTPDDLFNYLGGTPDQGGTWSPPLASGTGVFDPAQDPAGPYTYTVGGQGECAPQSTTVTVTINPIPNAGTNGQTTVCETDPSFDLFTLLGNNPETGGEWSPELVSQTGVFTPGVDQPGTYTYTIIGTFPCENSTATVTVEVESIPNPGEAGTAAFCENGAPEDLFNYLGGTPDQGGEWSPPLASGTGVFDPSQDLAGPYTYTVGGQGECAPQSTTVTVTINPIPNAGTNGQTTVCETDPSFDLFTLLGNNPEINGTWSPELASQTGVFTPGVDQPGTYTYTIMGTFPCENSTATVTVELESIPNPGEAGTAAFCENGTPDDLFNYLGGTPDQGGQWFPELASGTGVFDPAQDPAGPYTYTVGGQGECAPQSTTVTVTINPIPNAGTNGQTTVCETDPSFDLFTLLGNTPELNGTWSPELASQTGVFTPGVDQSGTYTYTIIGTFPCENSTATVTVEVESIPNPGTAGTAAFCENGAPEDLFNYLGGTPDQGGEWFPALASGTGVFDPAQDPAGPYTYTVGGQGECAPQSTTVIVTINPIPNAGTNGQTTVCETDPSFDLFTLLGNNPEINGTWSPELASGTGIFTPGVDQPGTYTYTIIGTFPCENSTATVTVEVESIPNPGEAGTADFCENGAPEDLFNYLGGTPDAGGTWSPPLASGTGVFDPSQDLADVYTYTVGGQGECAPQSTTVTVTINPIPNAGTNGQTTVCETDPSFDLFTLLGNNPELNGTWSPELASQTGVFTPGVDQSGTYTYTIIGTFPCENSTATVTVEVESIPNPGEAGTADFCENGAPEDLFNYLGGTPDAGGTWSPPLASGTGVFDPSQDLADVYTYTVGGQGECAPQSTTVTVTINPIPNAGTNGQTTVCETDPSFDLFTLLGNNPELNGTWSPELASQTGVFTPGVDQPGTYTYTIIGTFPCENSTATVTVELESIPNPGEAGTAAFCENGAPDDLFNYLGGTPDQGGQWFPELASGTGVFDPSQDLAGPYTYTVGGQGECAPQSTTVTVTINPIPNAGTNGQTTVCETDPSFDLFTLLGNNPELNGTWSPELASGTGIFTPGVDQPDTYTYTIIGTFPCDNSTATVTVTLDSTANAGNFTGIQSVCASEGTFDLNTLLDGSQQTDGSWTNDQGDTVSNIITITNFSPGTYNYTYTVTTDCNTDSETVQLTITQGIKILPEDIIVLSPICQGENSTVTIFNLADGNYSLNYSLTGSNTIANQIVLLTVVDGEVTFEIDTAQLANPGTTSLVFNSILNAATNCETVLTSLFFDIEILPLLTLANTNLTVQNVCLGTEVTVQISGATNLADGTYQFVYSIPNANPITGNSGNVVITGGAGQFTIPSSVFPTAGNYTLTFNSITSEVSPCTNLNPAVSVSFEILPAATTTEALVTLSALCANSDGTVSITNASDLSDGSYLLTYQITGVITHNETINVEFLNGETSFVIPSTILNNSGEITLSINQLNSNTGNTCGTPGHTFNSVTLTIQNVETPELVEGGNSFCEDDNATIANLSAGINSNETIIWYDAPSNGNAYTDTTVLVNGQVYYAAIQSSTGCESTIRLAVTVTIIQGIEILPEDIIVLSPICQGENSTVTIFNLADGNYSLNYSLTGSNTITNQIVLFTVVDGEVTFEIDTAQLANPGTTSLVFNSILNAATNCETVLTGLSFDIEILPLLTLSNTNLTVQNVCLGTEVIVQISGATNLADGTYQFVYSIPNANPITGNSGNVVITGGAGQFTIPSSVFPTAGNYTLTFNSITSEVSPCTNLNPAVSVSFEILPAATTTEALVTLSALCANSDGTVSITNAINLANGTYQLTYQITGAITHNETISVEFLNGQASFIIPSAVLTNFGEITISINQLNSNITTVCGTPGHTFNSITLILEEVGTPELVEGGNSFCEDINATIVSLTSGIVGEQTVIWYDAPVNGNAYDESTVLIDGQTYYASFQSSAGCGSLVRLAVTVSIRDCTDIIIPDGFSPNDDGINDFFVIKNIRTLYPNFDLEIFNRYGNVLYKGNAASQDWDGTSDKGIQVGGNKLPAGVYFFIINFNDGIRKPLQGRVYLSR